MAIISDIAAHFSGFDRPPAGGRETGGWGEEKGAQLDILNRLETAWNVLKPPTKWESHAFQRLNAPAGGGRETGETRDLHLPPAGTSQLHGPGCEAFGRFHIHNMSHGVPVFLGSISTFKSRMINRVNSFISFLRVFREFERKQRWHVMALTNDIQIM